MPQEVQHAVTDVVQQGIRSVVLSGVFSPVNPAHEIAAAAIIQDHLGPDGMKASHDYVSPALAMTGVYGTV